MKECSKRILGAGFHPAHEENTNYSLPELVSMFSLESLKQRTPLKFDEQAFYACQTRSIQRLGVDAVRSRLQSCASHIFETFVVFLEVISIFSFSPTYIDRCLRTAFSNERLSFVNDLHEETGEWAFFWRREVFPNDKDRARLVGLDHGRALCQLVIDYLSNNNGYVLYCGTALKIIYIVPLQHYRRTFIDHPFVCHDQFIES